MHNVLFLSGVNMSILSHISNQIKSLYLSDDTLACGGETRSHAVAQKDAWRETLKFIKHHLSSEDSNVCENLASKL